MRKGSLRWDEMMLAEHAARQSRWAPATERAKADAGAEPRAAPQIADSAGAPDAASSPPINAGQGHGAAARCSLESIAPSEATCLTADDSARSASATQQGQLGADAGSTPAPATIYPLLRLCVLHGLPEPIPEYRFHPLRKWRGDYVWPLHMLLVEIDGGVWTGGRHTRGAGFIKDMEKLNAAALLGYRVLRYTPDRLDEALRDLRMMLARV